ncbi:MAG TPA: transposase [Gemmataceae bacterium]|nr:transposase [Gemmataceae bacterium]
MPKQVLERWLGERETWLVQHGIDPHAGDWKAALERLPLAEQHGFHRKLSARWEACLDECHGACVLRRPELRTIVADSLRYFDGERYLLTDFVVMPNHVHVLVAFPDAEQLTKQAYSWKHFTGVNINKVLGQRGRFWEVDGFDHLVRSADQFEYLRTYIAENPRQARLQPGEYIHYTRDQR